MKLWHDDIREPPEGWTWVRTNKQAMLVLLDHIEEIDECSLDHDLGFENIDPRLDNAIYLRGSSPDGSGADLARWMVENECVPPVVTVHSMNPDGARRMAHIFADAGHAVTIKRYEVPS